MTLKGCTVRKRVIFPCREDNGSIALLRHFIYTKIPMHSMNAYPLFCKQRRSLRTDSPLSLLATRVCLILIEPLLWGPLPLVDLKCDIDHFYPFFIFYSFCCYYQIEYLLSFSHMGTYHFDSRNTSAEKTKKKSLWVPISIHPLLHRSN